MTESHTRNAVPHPPAWPQGLLKTVLRNFTSNVFSPWWHAIFSASGAVESLAPTWRHRRLLQLLEPLRGAPLSSLQTLLLSQLPLAAFPSLGLRLCQLTDGRRSLPASRYTQALLCPGLPVSGTLVCSYECIPLAQSPPWQPPQAGPPPARCPPRAHGAGVMPWDWLGTPWGPAWGSAWVATASAAVLPCPGPTLSTAPVSPGPRCLPSPGFLLPVHLGRLLARTPPPPGHCPAPSAGPVASSCRVDGAQASSYGAWSATAHTTSPPADTELEQQSQHTPSWELLQCEQKRASRSVLVEVVGGGWVQ